MESERGILLPFYLVVDVSWSMTVGNRLESANRITDAVKDALSTAPILSDKVRFALLDFSGDAQVRLSLCDLLSGVESPVLTARQTGTSYAAAFRLLRDEIDSNVRQLRADGFAVHRPAVFFLSDGEPTDPPQEWQTEFARLTQYDPATKQGFSKFPNFVPCGVAEADPTILRSLIHPSSGTKAMKMYLMDEGEDPARAIEKIAKILISSMLQSGRSIAAGVSTMIVPGGDEVPSGISVHEPDLVS
jgi:uncharacterized protein YegL